MKRIHENNVFFHQKNMSHEKYDFLMKNLFLMQKVKNMFLMKNYISREEAVSHEKKS